MREGAWLCLVLPSAPSRGSVCCPRPSLALSSIPTGPTPGQYRCKPEEENPGEMGQRLP